MIKIYCIECLETGEKYIGSTKQKLLSQRISYHTYKKSCSCKDIIERDNWKYYLIEYVEPSKRLIREQYWIDTTDNCINYRRAKGLTLEEYKKVYNQLNKDKIKKYNKERYDKDYHKKLFEYKCSWGGDKRNSNNLLLISLDLFN